MRTKPQGGAIAMSMYSSAAEAATARSVVTGQFLAKNKWSKARRTRLARQILAGKVELGPPCAKQVAALCRVDVHRLLHVRRGNGHANGRPAETLADHFVRSTLTERQEAAPTLGLDGASGPIISPPPP